MIETVTVRTGEVLREEFKIYFDNVSNTVAELMKESLKTERTKRMATLIAIIKGNRYAPNAFDLAISEMEFHIRDGKSIQGAKDEIVKLLYDKLDIPEDATKMFFKIVFDGIFKSDVALMYKFKAGIIEAIADSVKK